VRLTDFSPNESSLDPSQLFAEVGQDPTTGSGDISLTGLDCSFDACWPSEPVWPSDSTDLFALPTFDAPSTTHLSVQQPELDLGAKSTCDAFYASLLYGLRDDTTSSLSLPLSDDDSTPSLSSPSSETGSSSGVCTPKSQPAQLKSEDERAAGFREEMEWFVASLAQ
jgi:hypothetical protein